MRFFITPPSIPNPSVLDDLEASNAPLNRERQALSWWIHGYCMLGVGVAGCGVLMFSWMLYYETYWMEQMPHFYILLTLSLLWGVVLLALFWKARTGTIYTKINTILWLVLGLGGLGIYIHAYQWWLWDTFNARVGVVEIQFLLVYLAGWLTFPTAFYAWQYSGHLRRPQLQENNWSWKLDTALLGQKAWMWGTLVVLCLVLGTWPMILEHLSFIYYYRYLNAPLTL